MTIIDHNPLFAFYVSLSSFFDLHSAALLVNLEMKVYKENTCTKQGLKCNVIIEKIIKNTFNIVFEDVAWDKADFLWKNKG